MLVHQTLPVREASYCSVSPTWEDEDESSRFAVTENEGKQPNVGVSTAGDSFWSLNLHIASLKLGKAILEKDGWSLSLIPRSSNANAFIYESPIFLQNYPPHL